MRGARWRKRLSAPCSRVRYIPIPAASWRRFLALPSGATVSLPRRDLCRRSPEWFPRSSTCRRAASSRRAVHWLTTGAAGNTRRMSKSGKATRSPAGTRTHLMERRMSDRPHAGPMPSACADPAILEVNELKKYFSTRRGFLRRNAGNVFAVDGVSFSIRRGETLGLVGESGCGKSTVGRTALRLIEPTAGSIKLDGDDITHLRKKELRPHRAQMQIIFQDPFSSLDPRMSVGGIVGEPLRIHRLGSAKDRTARVAELFERVGLRKTHMPHYPHQFSGGQRQRIGIARARALAEAHRRRRTGFVPRCLHSGADPQLDDGPAARARLGLSLHFAQSGRGRAHKPLGRRDVSRPDRGIRRQGLPLHVTHSSLYRVASLRRAGPGPFGETQQTHPSG